MEMMVPRSDDLMILAIVLPSDRASMRRFVGQSELWSNASKSSVMTHIEIG